MANGDVRVVFNGEYDTQVVLTFNRHITSIAMEVDTYDELGKLSEHTFFSKEAAIAMAKRILEELQ